MLAVAPVVASALTVLRARLLEIFPPESLGSNGVSVLWFDPSDLSTMFQDVAATTPVTAPEQPVALWLDKGKGVGPNLIYNSAFDNDVDDWTANQPTTILSHGEDGTLVFTRTERTGAGGVVHYFPTVAGRYYRLTATLVSSTNFEDQGVMLRGGSNIGPIYHTFDAPGTASGVFKATDSNSVIYLRGTVGVNTWDNAEAREILGNHATQSVAPKRPTYQAGEGLHFLAFDGVDDKMSTDDIDFTGTDKLSVFAGVRKIDATSRIILELSNNAGSNAGSFYLSSGTDSGFTAYSSLARGTAPAYVNQVAGFSSATNPSTDVLAVTHDIAGDLSTMRGNGVAGTSGTGDKGAGNFGNHVLNIGSRGGTIALFNGNLYGLIIASKLASAAEITSVEKYLAGKTGVTI